jgi:hypothetical protein
LEPKPPLDLNGVVEPALARALVLAAEAQRWEIVEQVARELEERREGQSTAGPQKLSAPERPGATSVASGVHRPNSRWCPKPPMLMWKRRG